jgi:flagellar hook-associated protein 1
MSINQLINISRRSFSALDGAMNATAQNVANIETEGYTRRRVTLQSISNVPQGLYSPPFGKIGTGGGVSVQQYERLRDGLLQKSGWEARSGLGGFDAQHRLLMAVEGVVGSSGPGSIPNLLSEFYSSWSALADQPDDQGARVALRGNANALAGTLNRLDSDLQKLGENALGELHTTVDRTNSLLKEVATLNDVVTSSVNRGTPDHAAMDRRDQVIDELSTLIPISVQTDRRDGYAIIAGGMALVEGTTSVPLSVINRDGEHAVRIGDTPYDLRARGAADGAIGSTLHHLNHTLPGTRQDLDKLAAALVMSTNSAHRDGYGLRGSTGNDFFHYDAGPPEVGITAATIRLSDAVQSDAANIAASGVDTANGFLDSSVAGAIAGMRNDTGMIDGQHAPEAFAISVISGIGAGVRNASSEASARQNVVEHLTAMEKGVSGVSLEEEMTNLIRFQQAYAASARVLNAAQEMMDTILRL